MSIGNINITTSIELLTAIRPRVSECDISKWNATSPFPTCKLAEGFDFRDLATLATLISAGQANDSRLLGPDFQLLTHQACTFIAGPSYKLYKAEDIWLRLTTWKFPLLQLVAIFARPPLGFVQEAFVIAHLFGNPVGTIKSLLLKVASCQYRATFWFDLFRHELRHLLVDNEPGNVYPDLDRKWKALATITDSYDEWGLSKGNEAQSFLLRQLMSPRLDDDGKRKFLEIAQQTANALAADRSTKFLPIIVAQIFFISTIAIAFGRAPAAASGKNPSTYINIEVHSVGFSALYFWVIPTVILGSVIGVSQTENAIPRILRRFQKDINHTFPDLNDRLPNDHINGPDNSEIPATCIRERHGGIYSWRPSHIRRSHVQWLEGRRESRPCGKSRNNSTFRRFRHFFSLRPGSLACAQLLVFASLATGVIISVLVPPVGYGCRGIGETAIILAWILNGFLDSIPIPNQHLEFWLTFIRDLITTLATLIGIAVTQVGVFNQCSCFTLWGLTGLEIPQDVSVDAALQYGIKTIYPAIAFLGIVLQLVIFPGIIICQYSRALRVFLSRDDNTSNAPWWYSIRACFGYKHLPTSVATPCPPGSHADPDSVDAVDAVDVDGHSLMLSQYPSHT